MAVRFKSRHDDFYCNSQFYTDQAMPFQKKKYKKLNSPILMFPLTAKLRHFSAASFICFPYKEFPRGEIISDVIVFCLRVCPGPCTAIGVEDQYKVSDSQMTASSVYLQYYAYRGRLNGATGWCQSSQQITNYDYLQIDMRRLRYVCAVSTQGKKNGSWVTSYKLKFSIDGVTFYTYQENNMDKV